jgi:hypothetical protein
MNPVALDPALATSIVRYESALMRTHDLLAGLSDADAHVAPEPGAWSVAQCLDHLVVAGSKMRKRLEEDIARSRELGRVARSDGPARFSWFDKLFIFAVSRGPQGKPARFRVKHVPVFDPGPGRAIPVVVAEFVSLQDRLISTARSAQGLDLADIKVESLINEKIKVSLGAWFLVIAAHQERHLDQAARVRRGIGR